MKACRHKVAIRGVRRIGDWGLPVLEGSLQGQTQASATWKPFHQICCIDLAPLRVFDGPLTKKVTPQAAQLCSEQLCSEDPSSGAARSWQDGRWEKGPRG